MIGNRYSSVKQRHVVAAELVVAVAAKGILAAELVLVEPGKVSVRPAVLQARRPYLALASLEVALIADVNLLEMEVPAEAGIPLP
jgi:hypothetical protein